MDKEERLKKLVEKRKVLTEGLSEMKRERNLHSKKIDAISHKMKETVQAIKHISQSIGQLKGEYSGVKVSGKVSDHAIVRYLERYKGVDMLDVVSEILEHPDRRYSDDGMVTTIYPDDTPIMDAETKKDVKHILMRHNKNGKSISNTKTSN